jgi:Ku protein
MWKGAIQFGLVTIPVKLYVATESRAGVSFNMLHETDKSRIQMKIWCPEDEEIINRSETVKGYEYAPDKYVVITDEDLEKLPLKTVRSIEIEQFVEREEAEAQTKFVKQAYYIEPDRVGRKAFQLLKEVLQDKGLTAICKFVIRDREVLAAMDPFENTMLLSTIYWPDEIRALDELDRHLRSVELPRRVPRSADAGHRIEDRGSRDRRSRGRRGADEARRPHGCPAGKRQRGDLGARREAGQARVRERGQGEARREGRLRRQGQGLEGEVRGR